MSEEERQGQGSVGKELFEKSSLPNPLSKTFACCGIRNGENAIANSANVQKVSEKGSGEITLLKGFCPGCMGVSDFIGRPWRSGGRGPEAFDCWGLALAVYRELFMIELPLPFDIAAEAVMSVSKAFYKEMDSELWKKLDAPQAPCIAVMALHPDHPDLVNHCGVVIDRRRLLQTTEATGVILTRLDDPAWRGRIKGFYQWMGDFCHE